MNPRFFLRIRPQENRENVEKSEISEPKNETFGEKLTPVILETNARNGANTGLQPERKRGQRKSVPFAYGGAWVFNRTILYSYSIGNGRKCAVINLSAPRACQRFGWKRLIFRHSHTAPSSPHNPFKTTCQSSSLSIGLTGA